MGRDDDSEYTNISVSEPFMNADKVVFYKIVAYDIEGEFKCHRRYTDFDVLREAWKKRLPGLFIPSLPPKKIFGNTEQAHLELRSFALEQFLRRVYKIPYLIASEEFQIFARFEPNGQQGTLKKQFEALAE